MLQTVVKCATVAAALIATASCGPRPVASGSEKVSENTYRNHAFGVIVTAPDGWFVMDNAQTRKMMDAGLDVAVGDNERLKAAAHASAQQSGNLFAFFEYAPGTPVEFNPSVVGVTENLSTAPGVKTGRDYFFHVRKIMEQSTIKPEFMGDYQSRKIDGRDFDVMRLQMVVNGATVKQNYYAARHGDYAISFIQSYNSDEQLQATDAVIDSIRLDW
jgi:hypothetical protein